MICYLASIMGRSSIASENQRSMLSPLKLPTFDPDTTKQSVRRKDVRQYPD